MPIEYPALCGLLAVASMAITLRRRPDPRFQPDCRPHLLRPASRERADVEEVVKPASAPPDMADAQSGGVVALDRGADLEIDGLPRPSPEFPRHRMRHGVAHAGMMSGGRPDIRCACEQALIGGRHQVVLGDPGAQRAEPPSACPSDAPARLAGSSPARRPIDQPHVLDHQGAVDPARLGQALCSFSKSSMVRYQRSCRPRWRRCPICARG